MADELIPTNIALAAARQQLATIAVERSVVTSESYGPNPLLNAPLVGEGNPATIYLMLYHGTSKKTHTSRLKNIAGYMGAPNGNYEWLSWSQFTAPRVKSFLNSLYEPYIENREPKRRSPNTLNGYLDTIRGVMRQAMKLDLITLREWSDLQEIKPFRNDVPLAGRMASLEETTSIERECDRIAKKNPPKAARDRAIFRLAFLAGIRRHEFCNLDIEHLKLPEAKLEVLGKGGKKVKIEIGSDIIEALEEWLAFRGNPEEQALFFRIQTSGNILEERLTQEGIRYLFNSYSKKAGIGHLTAHDARRTFTSNILDDPDIDPKTAMDMARHASFNTTARYDRRSGEKRKVIADRLSMKPRLQEE